jgi:F0F1-type ATP synthase assembly protein I
MFIPIIGLTLLGVFGDNTYHTKPWLTIGGIIAGVALASLLVIRQLKKVNR